VTAPAAVLALLTLGLTAAAGPVFDLASRAAEQLLHPHEYMRAVLGTP
jgi:formate hydrogenlyase subunit 3/multisubunit Na+/H+ antiporter MnhD subunit